MGILLTTQLIGGKKGGKERLGQVKSRPQEKGERKKTGSSPLQYEEKKGGRSSFIFFQMHGGELRRENGWEKEEERADLPL